MHMVKWLSILALLLTVLVPPHQVTAHTVAHSFDQPTVTDASNADTNHRELVEALYCCDATMAGCVVAVLPPRAAPSPAFIDISSKHAILCSGRAGGIDISFDPPPPRV